MKILDCKEENISIEKINEIIDVINNGKIAVIPTDTVYGIGASIKCEDAIKRIYNVKNRDIKNRINILVSSKEMSKKYVTNYNEVCDKLIDKFWPGPLTIIFKKNDNVPNIITAGTDTVGIRMCDNSLVNKVIEKLDTPLAVPSANKSGRPSGTNISDIVNEFNDEIDLYVDYGDSKIGIESTIVEIIDDENVKILRSGKITKDEIETLGINVVKDNNQEINRKHYKINIDTINVESVEKAEEIIIKNSNKKVAIVAFDEYINSISKKENVDIYSLKSFNDTSYAMKNIYQILREIEGKKYDLCILLSPSKENGIEWIIHIFKEAGK